jgi:hypothetical protein
MAIRRVFVEVVFIEFPFEILESAICLEVKILSVYLEVKVVYLEFEIIILKAR